MKLLQLTSNPVKKKMNILFLKQGLFSFFIPYPVFPMNEVISINAAKKSYIN